MHIREGNKDIAEFLGYKYISSKSPDHDRNRVYGLGHGYWIKTRPITHDGKVIDLPSVKPKPELKYHSDWAELMKAVVAIESISTSSVQFIIGKYLCKVSVFHPTDFMKNFETTIENETKDEAGKRKALWQCVVLYCRFHRGDFEGSKPIDQL